MSEQTKLKPAINEFKIEGILSEKDLEVKQFGKDKIVTGKLKIKTDEHSEHIVDVYAGEKTKNGTDNPAYKGLLTVMNDYNAIADVGKDNADKVRITSGQIGRNEYYIGSGELRSYIKYSTMYVNRVRENEVFEPHATFEIETYITGIYPEIKDDEETGRIIIKGLTPVYGKSVIVPLDFIIEANNTNAIDFIEQEYEVGDTVKLYGKVINSLIVEKTVEAMAFGEDIEKIKKTTVRELVVTSGTYPYEEEMPNYYTKEIIQKALVERESYLKEMKEKNENKNKTKNTGNFSTNVGFGSSASSYDIPF